MATEGAAAGVAALALLGRWQRYLEVSGRCGERTRRSYRRAVTNFFADVYADPEWIGPRDPLDLTEDDAVEYVRRYTPGRGPMRGLVLRALRSYYGFAAERGVIVRSPFARLRPDRPRYGAAPTLSRDELDRVLDAAAGIDPRARPAILLQYATGCRVAELVALTSEDVSQGRIDFRVTKGDRPRSLPLVGPAAEAVADLLGLADYVPQRGTRRPTLVGVGYERYRQWLKDAGERAGVEVWTHLLRHTRATVLAEAGTDDVTLMSVFGWEDPRMIKRYAARSEPNMRAALSIGLGKENA